MGQEENKQSVKEQWQALNVDWKCLYQLTDNNVLVLKSSVTGKERAIASLTPDGFQAAIQDMESKFEEAINQLEALKADWQQQPEKLHLAAALSRYRHFVDHLQALGNFEKIDTDLRKMESDIQAIYDAHYSIKLAIAEKAEGMRQAEGVKKEEWDVLLEEWKQAPVVEKEKNDALWQRIEKARNAYYENKQELIADKNKTLMQNLDWKMEVCDQAESWAGSEKWHEATEAFKELFERWKDIGHVPSLEKNDELWARFQKARDTFFSRKTAYFEQTKKEQEENLARKLQLVEEAETLKDQTTWKETAAAFDVIMAKWKIIGKVPYERSDEIWQRLQAARDCFYNARRENRKEIETKQAENLAIKEELAEKAQSLKDSPNWESVTNEMNKLMSLWKKTGPVPREKSEEIWMRFLSARKHFFAKKDAAREARKAKFTENLKSRIHQTRQFLHKLKEEQAEDAVNLEDFKQSLLNTNGMTSKDLELRHHLTGLITDLEKRMPSREAKIKDVEQQLAALTDSKKQIEERGRSQNTKPVEKDSDHTEGSEETFNPVS
ncbi:MAG TPA: DUF349 domain-containing protein [Edaphocola sp.]|nr:DUF349 domain-containing protein [Edaphocola sp.]